MAPTLGRRALLKCQRRHSPLGKLLGERIEPAAERPLDQRVGERREADDGGEKDADHQGRDRPGAAPVAVDQCVEAPPGPSVTANAPAPRMNAWSTSACTM